MGVIEIIKQPFFWILTAVASVTLSIIANLITPWVARILSKYFESKRKIQEFEKQRRLTEIHYLFENIEARVNVKIDAAYWVLRGVMLLAISLLLFSIFPYLSYTMKVFGNFLIPKFVELSVLPLATICMIRSVQWLDRAKNIIRPAFKADKREKEMNDFQSRSNVTDSETKKFLLNWDENNVN